MKRIGILGGLAWPATIEYYKAICQLSQKHHANLNLPGPSPMPEMCIESVNINYSYNRRGSFGNEKSWKDYDEYFHAALKRLEDNGVDFAIIASNTPHNRYDSITKGLKIPVISIFESVAETCKINEIDEFLLLGTEPTMNSGVFPDYLKRHGIRAIVPSDETVKLKVVGLISELFKGKSENGRSRIDQVVRSSFEQTEIKKKVVCLACTELPLVFEGKEQYETFGDNGVFYLNTTIIHANAAFRYAIEG
ncbi:MAG: amino acid racemase [Deltaproteobacteria bacterium]|nr:amino acid racemase [Deltaproteobacteria bacterium]